MERRNEWRKDKRRRRSEEKAETLVDEAERGRKDGCWAGRIGEEAAEGAATV